MSLITLIHQGQAEEGFAQACEQACRVDEAQAALDVAAPMIATGVVWLEAEFLRVRGRLSPVRGEPPAVARADFKAALEVARRQGASKSSDRAIRELDALDAVHAGLVNQ